MLADRMRPRNFSEIVGQDTSKLITALNRKEPPRAFLLHGPSGTGKTSTAYLIANFFNCVDTENRPCGDCEICESSYSTSCMDVRILNAKADLNVESTRQLIDDMRYRPLYLKTKTYIFDEAHELTKDSAECLLTILENLPEYIVCIFATTAPDKLKTTLKSRLFPVSFRAVENSEIVKHLLRINRVVNLEIKPDEIFKMAQSSDGNLRYAINLMEGGSSDNLVEKEITRFWDAFKSGNELVLMEFIFNSSFEPIQTLIYILNTLKNNIVLPKARVSYNALCSINLSSVPVIMKHQLFSCLISSSTTVNTNQTKPGLVKVGK